MNDMGTRKLSVSYLADIDTLFVHFESKIGFYSPLDEDDRISARYDAEGNLIGFMIEGLREFEAWSDLNLPEIDEEQAQRHRQPKVKVTSNP